MPGLGFNFGRMSFIPTFCFVALTMSVRLESSCIFVTVLPAGVLCKQVYSLVVLYVSNSLLVMQAPEKGIRVKELFKELLPLVTSGAVIFDKKTLEKQLVETVLLAILNFLIPSQLCLSLVEMVLAEHHLPHYRSVVFSCLSIFLGSPRFPASCCLSLVFQTRVLKAYCDFSAQLNASSKFDVRGKWVALAAAS